MSALNNSVGQLKQQLNETSGRLEKVSHVLEEKQDEYKKLKSVIKQNLGSRTKRRSNPTTLDMVFDSNSSTKYRCRCESKGVMEFSHGGQKGAMFGAWDLLLSIFKLSNSYVT